MWYLKLPNSEELLFKNIATLVAYLNDRNCTGWISFIKIYEPPTKLSEERKDKIVEPTPLSR